MKRIAYSLLAALGVAAIATPAQAIVGGPWDNNLFYSPTVNGTFQGTATAKNLSAVMIFSVGSNSSTNTDSTDVLFPNAGRMVSFYRGGVTVSGVEAVPDASTRKIAATITERSSNNLSINGFMEANFDNVYPSITYKGKAEMLAFWVDTAGDVWGEEFQARVRGIKTSTSTSGNWIWR